LETPIDRSDIELPARPTTTLKDAAFAGVRWVLVARAAGEVLAFAAAVSLAHLVSPAEFGRAAVALALVPLAVILTFEGCASALVQRPTITYAQRDVAILMSLGVGALLSLLSFALAYPVGGLVFGQRTAGLIELVSPVFLLASVGAVPRAMLWRQLDFKRVGLVEVASLTAGAGVSVSLAFSGVNAEAIIAGALATTAVSSALLFAASPFRPRLLRRRDAAGDIAGFGIPAALAGLVHVGFANADYVILAARLSPTSAGLYWRAFQLGVSYQEKISGIMLRIAFPLYARTTDRDELRRLHERATRLHATTVLPLLAILIVAAPVLIPWLFGPAWRGAVVPSQILAVAGMVAAIMTGYPQVMLAVGRPKPLLRFNVGMLIVYAGVVLLAAPHGLTVVCITVVGAHLLILVAVYRLLLWPYAGVPMSRLLTDTLPALAGCLALLGAGYATREAIHGPAVVDLAAIGIVGGLAYLACIRFLFPAAWDDVSLVVRRVVPARRRSPATVPAFSPGAP
jgi:O-antigen/teichoic acid export membrane protein